MGATNHRICDSSCCMDADRNALPDDVDALKDALLVERARAFEVTAELMVARARAAEDEALIAQQRLRIAKPEPQVYGQRSERSARLIDQLALTFEEMDASATEDELAAEAAVAKTTSVREFTRRRSERNTFPDHLPRERVVIDPPTACECCGGNRLRKLRKVKLKLAGTTMMACPEALMAQESRFLDALARVDGYRIDEAGTLVLTAAKSAAITAKR